VIIEYDLWPSVTVTSIVQQARVAIAWVYRHIGEFGGDSSRLYVSGLSAGGHLAALALAHDWEKAGLPKDIIKGAVAISGVYDLDPVLYVSVNEEIRLDAQTARANSPMLHPPLPVAPILIAIGASEPEGWKQMSRDFFNMCRTRGMDCDFMEVPGVHHYSISAALADPDTALSQAIVMQMCL
jgi:arylformamidase